MKLCNLYINPDTLKNIIVVKDEEEECYYIRVTTSDGNFEAKRKTDIYDGGAEIILGSLLNNNLDVMFYEV